MPHQDEACLRQNVAALKDLFGQILPREINSFSRHGNAKRDASFLASVAIICHGLTNHGTLRERVRSACAVVGLMRKNKDTITRQGLFQGLATCGQALIELIIQTLYIAPGSPWENGFAESFHSKLVDEFLTQEEFDRLTTARKLMASWKDDYNHVRPHSSLGYLTPAEFAARCSASVRPAASLQQNTDIPQPELS